MQPTIGRKPWIVLAAVAVVLSSWPAAQAIPAFARKYDLSCTACHSAWPTLNDYGRKFKENGYRLEPGSAAPDGMKKVDDNLVLEAGNYFTGRVKGLLYDKKDTNARWRLRPAHEAELMAAGNAGNDFSFWMEFEAEDEPEEGGYFTKVETAVLGWHPSQTVNFVGGTGPLFWADPYQTLAEGGRRMTLAHKAPLNTGFGVGEKLRGGTPFVTFYGRSNGFYYSATLASGSFDKEGGDEKDAALRLAYDFPWLTIGAFYVDGSVAGDTLGTTAASSVDYTRAGIDFQIEQSDFYLQGLYVDATDDTYDASMVTGDQSNSAYYVQAFYVINSDSDTPVVPLVRYESVEFNDGNDSIDSIAAAITAYVRRNINISFEYWKETSVPAGMDKNDRKTLLFNVLF